MSAYAWAPGYLDDGDRPKIVTSRFAYEDGHTLSRYLATGGYDGLRAALSRTPAQVHDEVKTANVLGRGGAGFPAGTKWGLTPAEVWPRYLVVNGDESEPGTYKDRLLMERDPHQLIEGIVIACYALNAAQAFLYVRGEMALAQERLAAALNDAYAHGKVGRRLCGTDLSVEGPGSGGGGACVGGGGSGGCEGGGGGRGL
ncbi:MAG: NADH-quinone oxidoreductase subunit F, partial [Gemmatimonadota bacterium]